MINNNIFLKALVYHINMQKWTDPQMRQQVFLFPRTILNKIKAFSEETGQPFDKIIESGFKDFTQYLINKCAEIDEIRYNAILAEKKAKEDQELIAQFPLKVPGHEVDPIDNETTATA